MNNDKQQLKILTQQIWNFIHSDECEDWSGEGGLIISALIGVMVNLVHSFEDIGPEEAIAWCKEMLEDIHISGYCNH